MSILDNYGWLETDPDIVPLLNKVRELEARLEKAEAALAACESSKQPKEAK